MGGRQGHNYTLVNVAHRGTFLSSQDGLSWHLRALHCKFQMYKDDAVERRRASYYTGAPFW